MYISENSEKHVHVNQEKKNRETCTQQFTNLSISFIIHLVHTLPMQQAIGISKYSS